MGYDVRKKRKRDFKEVVANSLVILMTRTIASVFKAIILSEELQYLGPYALLKIKVSSLVEHIQGLVVTAAPPWQPQQAVRSTLSLIHI